MKKGLGILLAIIMLIPNSISTHAESIDYTADLTTLQGLISEGTSITDYSSPEAYVWVTRVLNYNEKYATSYVYNDIKNECNSAKDYSNISTFNCANKILGYLLYLENCIYDNDAKSVRDLIEYGRNIDDYKSPDAYKWLVDVLTANEKYKTSFVYSYIKSECNSAKDYSDISTFNCANKILGYLSVVQDEIDGTNTKSLGELIDCGNALSDKTSADAYKWIIDVLKTNESFPTSSVYSDIKNRCNSAIDYSDISTFNEHSRILADLILLNDEVVSVDPTIVSKSLKSISIATPPTKTVYKEGETFSKAGMKVNATYEQIWSDGLKDIKEYEDVLYTVDTTTPLTAQENSITILFEDNGITKTTQLGIIVESYIVSTTLNDIVIVSKPAKLTYIEGEKFDKTGLSVDAKFLTTWSNGYEEYTTEKNIAYFVNTSSPLLASNKSWTVSYIADGIKKEIKIPIVVNPKGANNRNVKIPTVSRISMKINTKKKKIIVSWKRDSSVTGYQIQISTKSNFKGAKKINLGKSKKTYIKKGLKSKKRYYVRIKAYKTYKDNGIIKKAYGRWTIKSRKIK